STRHSCPPRRPERGGHRTTPDDRETDTRKRNGSMSSETSGLPKPPPFITRDRLADGSLLATWRAKSPPGTIRTDEELDASLEATLASHAPGEDVIVFGYGSLMWNPAIEHVGAERAYVHGWSRRFCSRSTAAGAATAWASGSRQGRCATSCGCCGGARCSQAPTRRAGYRPPSAVIACGRSPSS